MNTSFTSKLNATAFTMTKMEKRLQDLEELTTTLSSNLEEEINSRQQLERNSISNQAGCDTEIKGIKEELTQLGNTLNEGLSDIKKEINKDVDNKNGKVLALMEDKIKIMGYYDKKLTETSFAQNSFESEIKTKFTAFETEIKDTLKNIKDNISISNAKLDFLEKKVNENYELAQESINNLSKEVLQFKAEISSFSLFKENTNNNFKSVHEDMLNQEEIINSFSSKVNYTLAEYQNKLKSFEGILNQELEKIKSNREDLQRRVDLIETKFNSKVNEFDAQLFKQANYNTSEIDNFETHILSEMDKFQQFIQGRYDEQNQNVKKLIDFTNEDINILKNKFEKLDILSGQSKQEFFKSLKQTEEFMTRKYEELFRIISTGGNPNNPF